MTSLSAGARGYAPGWLTDYATVGYALHKNFSSLGPFSSSDVLVGLAYLWEVERAKRRAESSPTPASSDPPCASAPEPGILGPGPCFEELDDLRALCVATEVRPLTLPAHGCSPNRTFFLMAILNLSRLSLAPFPPTQHLRRDEP